MEFIVTSEIIVSNIGNGATKTKVVFPFCFFFIFSLNFIQNFRCVETHLQLEHFKIKAMNFSSPNWRIRIVAQVFTEKKIK